MEKDFAQFVKDYESKVIPLSRDADLAYFNATISGKKEDYDRSAELEIKRSKIYSSKEDFEKLKHFRESGLISDPTLKRELETLYNAYLENQVDEKRLEEIIKLRTDIENKFSTFRAEVNGKKLTDNEVEEILKNSRDSRELKAAWLGHKAIGKVVASDVVRLAKMRNESARQLGFKNYHEMSLKLSEQDPQEIEKLFDELDDLTREAFVKLKGEMDAALAKRYGISPKELMPWHYQNRFFQEAPKIYEVDLDAYYKGKDIVELTKAYYSGIGLPMSDLAEKSDLYEKEGKYQHAYCTSIDREGDVRVVMNVKPNYNWMNTSLHEFGHAVYDKFADRNLPWQLREPAHTFTTEAVAMLFGRFASNPAWMQDVLGISDEEKAKIGDAGFKSLRLEQLVFSRWVQVVYRFEKSMYENPDQDLNKLWWDLVEKYQGLKRPEGRNEPDWASKIHISSYPCYYHNYMLGELLASQLYYHITEKVLKASDPKGQSFSGRKEVGSYLVKNVFEPGRKYYWNDMIEKATGEKLTAKYYAKQFVE
ncbi:MAG: M2 family metallopeptidase [Ignavibacteria bacterium]|nr:M2 family metallopeptidase [Ignavibacteria bacterium]MCU7503350.1 M2 family metallopeptidase [Ignavibacteria bacterium]MCU7515704.1 M2 family metallopeptidase [Ignavibacteria bacterium]